MILAATDTDTRMNLRATLSDYDVAGDDGLATKLLHAETFAAGVASVLDGALSFLMSHDSEVVE